MWLLDLSGHTVEGLWGAQLSSLLAAQAPADPTALQNLRLLLRHRVTHGWSYPGRPCAARRCPLPPENHIPQVSMRCGVGTCADAVSPELGALRAERMVRGQRTPARRSQCESELSCRRAGAQQASS